MYITNLQKIMSNKMWPALVRVCHTCVGVHCADLKIQSSIIIGVIECGIIITWEKNLKRLNSVCAYTVCYGT